MARATARTEFPSIVVESDRWWDARVVGIVHFACEPWQLMFDRDTKDAATVETRWHGTPPGQRMQFRLRSEVTVDWTDWIDISEYATTRKVADTINQGK
jgi:hypothetical protein